MKTDFSELRMLIDARVGCHFGEGDKRVLFAELDRLTAALGSLPVLDTEERQPDPPTLLDRLEFELRGVSDEVQDCWTYENRHTSAHALLRDCRRAMRAALLSRSAQEPPKEPK